MNIKEFSQPTILKGTQYGTTVTIELDHSDTSIDEVMDGAVTEASLKSAKEWLNTTGNCPHYINPVHAVLVSKYNLFPNMSETYTWRAKITAAASDRTRLCAS
jgi:hypothetical protein